MSKAKLLADVLGGTALLSAVVIGSLGGMFIGSVLAQTPAHAALTGKVTSQAEGPMEGVLIGARKAGSTIATWGSATPRVSTGSRTTEWNRAVTR